MEQHRVHSRISLQQTNTAGQEQQTQHSNDMHHTPQQQQWLSVALHASPHESHLEGQELFTLLVTGVPTSCTESDLRALFQQYGDVSGLCVMRNNIPGQPWGAALLSYASKQQAAQAIQHLSTVQLAGAQPLQARYVISTDCMHQINSSWSSPLRTCQNNGNTASSSAPFAQQQQQQEDEWADCISSVGLLQSHSRLESATADHVEEQLDDDQSARCMLFFAKVSRNVTVDELRQVFCSFGEVLQLDLFAEPDAASSKGCGLVVYRGKEAAAAAIAALSNKFTWHGMRSPMVVKQTGQQKQQVTCSQSHLQPPQQRTPVNHPKSCSSTSSSTHSSTREHSDVPPEGCAPDAFKLFVGNLPKHCTETELRQVLESVGPVVKLVLLHDRREQRPSGSAFVWYANAYYANMAIQQLNNRVTLAAAHDLQDSPKHLVVCRATPLKLSTAAAGGGGGGGGGNVKLAMQQQQQHRQQAQAQYAFQAGCPQVPAAQQQQQQYICTASTAAGGVQPAITAMVVHAVGSHAHGSIAARSCGSSSSACSSVHSRLSIPPGQQLMLQQQQEGDGSPLVPTTKAALGSYGANHCYMIDRSGSSVTTSVNSSLGNHVMVPSSTGADISGVLAGHAATAGGLQYLLPAFAQLGIQQQQQPVVASNTDPAHQQQQQEQNACGPMHDMAPLQQQRQPAQPMPVAFLQTTRLLEQQQWQQSYQPAFQQQQRTGTPACQIHPAALSVPGQELQQELAALPLRSNSNLNTQLPAAGASPFAQQQQQQPMQQSSAVGLQHSTSLMHMRAASIDLCSSSSGAMIPSSAGPAAVTGMNVGVQYGLTSEVPCNTVGVATMHLSATLTPSVSLHHCVAVLNQRMETVASLSGAAVALLLRGSPPGDQHLVVDITGNQTQVAAAYGHLCTTLQQDGVASLEIGSTLQTPIAFSANLQGP